MLEIKEKQVIQADQVHQDYRVCGDCQVGADLLVEMVLLVPEVFQELMENPVNKDFKEFKDFLV